MATRCWVSGNALTNYGLRHLKPHFLDFFSFLFSTSSYISLRFVFYLPVRFVFKLSCSILHSCRVASRFSQREVGGDENVFISPSDRGVQPNHRGPHGFVQDCRCVCNHNIYPATPTRAGYGCRYLYVLILSPSSASLQHVAFCCYSGASQFLLPVSARGSRVEVN